MKLLSVFVLALGACASPGITTPDGVELSWVESGEGEPALVLIPGWCCDKSIWESTVSEFEGERRVVALDLGGHGESTLGQREHWDLRDYPGDVLAAMDSLGIEHAILVGHSMGGPVSLLTASEAPDRIVGVIGIDTLHSVDQQFSAEQMAGFSQVFMADREGFLRQFVTGAFAEGSDPEAIEAVIQAALAVEPEVAGGLLASFGGLDLGAHLVACPAPVVCVNGTMQPTAVDANRVHDPDYQVRIMEGAGHWPMLESPDEFAAALREALSVIER